jgi:uncharacterized protein (UPF0261 family)
VPGSEGDFGLSPPRVVVLATLDTKGAEATYLAERLRAFGCIPVLMDVGLGSPQVAPDVSALEVMAAAGAGPEKVWGLRRDEAMRLMGEGAGALLAAGWAEGRYAAAMALGGNQGTAIAGVAFRYLPIGFPKLVVSTVASGNLRPYFGHKDFAVMFSVGDLLGGPNRVTRPILDRAAAAVAAMARLGGGVAARPGLPAVAVTAFGNTHRAVVSVREHLAGMGWEVVAFHASGAGGSAMEELIEAGLFSAVLDLTTHELVGEIFGDDIYAPTRPGRLTAAARRGIPQVVAPGGLDYFCFGSPDSVPAAYRGRPTHYHNPFNTNVRTTAEELARLGSEVAARLNLAPPGRAAFVYPARGWSEVGSPGGPLYDPEANAAFLAALKANLSPAVALYVVDAAINEPPFVRTVCEVFGNLAGEVSDVRSGS